MLDARLRPLIDPPLEAAGRWLVGRGLGADAVTLAALALGLLAAIAIGLGAPALGLVPLLAGRLADGLDGAVARAGRGPTDRGGFLDIGCDFVLYAAVPLAFAFADPVHNALAAAFLLAGFLVNGTAFLAFAVMAGKRGLETRAQGSKSLYYLSGLAEGSETILVFAAMCLWPGGFPWLAAGFAALCLVSGTARLVMGWRMLGDRPEA